MKQQRFWLARSGYASRRGQHASARIVLLALVCLIAGFAAGVYWIPRTAKLNGPVALGATGERGLSEGTQALLKGLDSAVEIRYYALLDPTSVSDSFNAFAERVDRLLTEYRQESRGKIKLTRYTSPSDSATKAAAADGIKPFNMHRGEPCYLGLTVAYKNRKETLPHLSPDWEPAIEADLSRALIRVLSGGAAGTAFTAPAEPDRAMIEEVRRLIPDWESVSVQGGTQILRAQALQEFATAKEALEQKVQAAEQRFVQAQSADSASAQQAALQDLQQLRAQQADSLKQLAARLQAQISALEFLKRK